MERNVSFFNRYSCIDLGGSCYIYPKGGCAEVLSNILKDAIEDIELLYLDDSHPVDNLANKAQSIKYSQKYVLVCGGDVQEILCKKCENLGVKFVDGRE
ncbi:MAG: hypothetical protein K2I63_00350, partial [Helicobacter sp.]|nr:hypothetical protein [Helicobacter sp.]